MTRRAYGCRLNRPAAPHPGAVLAQDIVKESISCRELSEKSGVPEHRITLFLGLGALPTQSESILISRVLGRGKNYYHKLSVEWREENA